MFDPSSRYFAIATALYVTPDGREYLYKRRRMLPQAAPGAPASEVLVGPSDRLDLIAARALGDPLQFWRIADVNAAMDPFALVEPARVLVLAPAVRVGK